MAGRPTKLTDRTRQVLLEVLRSGLTIDAACNTANIDRSTYHAWHARAKRAQKKWHKLTPKEQETERLYIDFQDATTRAIDESEFVIIGAIRAQGMPHEVIEVTTTTKTDGKVEVTERKRVERDGRMLTWLAERRWPERYGRQVTQVQVTGADGGPVQVDLAARAADAVARAQAKLERQQDK